MKSNKHGDNYSASSNRKRNPAAKKQTALILTLTAIALVLLALVFYMLHYAVAANDFKNLSQQVQEAEATASVWPQTVPVPLETPPIETAGITETVPANPLPPETVPTETEPEVKTILPKYTELSAQNPELYGWIRIDDTVIDYPVMYSSGDPEKYLHANFEGEYSYPGTPFADSKCSNESDNILIYGHNMLDGSMFRSLIKYENKSYWEAHPTIMYSDLYEDSEYEIVAAFYDRVYKKSETCFKFYQFIDAEDEADFDYAMEQFKTKAIYDTGVEAVYGDQLITLITCAYHTENGRFVVVARKIPD